MSFTLLHYHKKNFNVVLDEFQWRFSTIIEITVIKSQITLLQYYRKAFKDGFGWVLSKVFNYHCNDCH